MNAQEYEKRLQRLLLLEKRMDKELFAMQHLFESHSIHFSERLADVQEDLYYARKDVDSLRMQIQSLLHSLEHFAKVDQVQRLTQLAQNMKALEFVSAQQFSRMIAHAKEQDTP